MIKNNRIFRFALAASIVLSGLAVAGSTRRGSETKGRNYFRQTCKGCHTKGAKGGEVTPLTKTMSQWDRFFEKQQHNPEGLKGLSEQDLKDIQQFLFDHAADSPQPETCG